MFTPNLVGKLKRVTGRDIHGSPTFAPEVSCSFAVVNAKVAAEKTSVRADSSASRGAGEEVVAALARILVAKHQTINVGDYFSFDDGTFEIDSKHARRSVFGVIDHYECDLRALPV